MTSIEELNPELKGIGRYEFGWADPDVLSGRTAQTVMVEKSGKITYRARFTGFDEAAATTACKAIKRQKTPCQPQGPS